MNYFLFAMASPCFLLLKTFSQMNYFLFAMASPFSVSVSVSVSVSRPFLSNKRRVGLSHFRE
jgi:hypothetical protein